MEKTLVTKKKDRGLSEEFMIALKTGALKPVLELVRADNTLDLQIRDDYINIYYRGGNLLRVERSELGFEGGFDWAGYAQAPKKSRTGQPKLRISLLTKDDVVLWIEQVPRFKHLMDRYITKHPHEEREVQQIIVRENNYGGQATSTDYFICDIEFTQSNEKFRFDMIAAHWPSTARARKNTMSIGLSFIEVKYGDGALATNEKKDKKGKTAGIEKHLTDMKEFLKNPDSLKSVAEQMKKVFNQKVKLGLVSGLSHEIGSFDIKSPDYIFILGNHHQRKSNLDKILSGINEATLPFKLKFAVSNFMGFGLYDSCTYTLEEFREKFEKEIYSK